MKIKLLKSKVVNGSVELAGSVVEAPERVAKKWIEEKDAEVFAPPPPPGLDTAGEHRLLDHQGRGEKKSKSAEAKE